MWERERGIMGEGKRDELGEREREGIWEREREVRRVKERGELGGQRKRGGLVEWKRERGGRFGMKKGERGEGEKRGVERYRNIPQVMISPQGEIIDLKIEYRKRFFWCNESAARDLTLFVCPFIPVLSKKNILLT